MIGLITAFDENQTAYFDDYVGSAVKHPAVWSYYVADDAVFNISVWRELLAALPPLKAVVKAQAGTEEAYLLSVLCRLFDLNLASIILFLYKIKT